jgi:peptide chain release factor 1
LRVYRDVDKRIGEAREMQKDPEMRDLARQEETELAAEQERLEKTLRELLMPKDPNDEKNIILEIRAGTGGEEAALFAADLFRMYTRFAERRRWAVEILSMSSASAGGIKEVQAGIAGQGAYSQLKYESGVHRVQRVPATEAQGRIHTSTATVAVLPEAEEVDVDVNPTDLRIDVFRSGGHGGQSVNTTDSAVRITHQPTGLVVTCQDERSQLQNKDRAMKILRARLFEAERERAQQEASAARLSQIGTGERSEKIRTYNYPQNRATDHRVNLDRSLETVLAGNLQPFTDALAAEERRLKLAAAGTQAASPA